PHASSNWRAHPMIQRMRGEIVQRGNATHHRLQGLGNGDVRGIGYVPLAVHLVIMDLGLKGFFHLPCRAAELYGAAALSYTVNPKTAVLKPVGDDIQILLADAESISKLLRSQPFAVVRRSR